MKNPADQRRVTVQPASIHSEEALRLIRELSSELGGRYGDDGTGAFSPADMDISGAVFVIAWLDGHQAVGCGALRPMEEAGVGEVKRMYVAPEARGQGISRRILAEIESLARQMGYTTLRLETGIRQPEAIRLYDTSGYSRIPCYGCYAGNPLSICFEKRLPQP
jgi:GNAT superfamily N-acetyltransferase